MLFNNATMGLIRKNQAQQYHDRFINCDFINPDYALLARSFGIAHHCIREEQDIEQVFAQTDFHAGINLIEIMIDKNSFPNYLSRR